MGFGAIMHTANDDIMFHVRMAPKLTILQQSQFEYNSWIIGHDLIDLRRFLENFGIDWRIPR